MTIRAVRRIVQAQPTVEGAGVNLRRAFGFGDTSETEGLSRVPPDPVVLKCPEAACR